MDPIEQLAEARLRELAIDVEVQLEKGTQYRPVLWLLVHARKRAAGAMKLFLDVDPADAHAVRLIQIELKVYDDMVANCRMLVARGRDADHVIAEKDRTEMSEAIMNMSDDDRRLYQLQPRGID
jgi:hypothetical protein